MVLLHCFDCRVPLTSWASLLMKRLPSTSWQGLSCTTGTWSSSRNNERSRQSPMAQKVSANSATDLFKELLCLQRSYVSLQRQAFVSLSQHIKHWGKASLFIGYLAAEVLPWSWEIPLFYPMDNPQTHTAWKGELQPQHRISLSLWNLQPLSHHDVQLYFWWNKSCILCYAEIPFPQKRKVLHACLMYSQRLLGFFCELPDYSYSYPIDTCSCFQRRPSLASRIYIPSQTFCIRPDILVSARTELTLLLVAGTVLCFAFSVRIMLTTHWCFSCC